MTLVDPALTDFAQRLVSAGIRFSEMGLGVHPEIDEVIFDELLSFGVIFPYADAVAYGNNALLVAGDSGMGKSSIANGFSKIVHSTVLAQDDPIVYSPNGELPKVYSGGEHTFDQPFLKPLTHPNTCQEYETKWLIHLREGDDECLVPGDLELALDFMVYEGLNMKRSADRMRKILPLFEGVHCYDFFKPKNQVSPVLAMGYADVIHEEIRDKP